MVAPALMRICSASFRLNPSISPVMMHFSPASASGLTEMEGAAFLGGISAVVYLYNLREINQSNTEDEG
jgi:hypothetical protein